MWVESNHAAVWCTETTRSGATLIQYIEGKYVAPYINMVIRRLCLVDSDGLIHAPVELIFDASQKWAKNLFCSIRKNKRRIPMKCALALWQVLLKNRFFYSLNVKVRALGQRRRHLAPAAKPRLKRNLRHFRPRFGQRSNALCQCGASSLGFPNMRCLFRFR